MINSNLQPRKRRILADSRWFMNELAGALDRLRRYSIDHQVQEEWSRGSLVYQILETYGMLERLGANLERRLENGAGTGSSTEVRVTVDEWRALRSEVRSTLTADRSLLGELFEELDCNKLLREVEDYVELAHETTGQLAPEDAKDLIVGRDNLELVLGGVVEFWGPEGTALQNARSVTKRVDSVLHKNVSVFEPGRSWLDWYCERFNAAARGYPWWDDLLSPKPAFWSRVMSVMEPWKTGVAEAVGELRRLPTEGTKLVAMAARELQDWLWPPRLAEARLAAAGEEERTCQVAVLDRRGTVLREIMATIKYGPVIERGHFIVRLVLPDDELAGNAAVVAVHLGEHGMWLVNGGVVDNSIGVRRAVEIAGVRHFAVAAIEVAILS